MRQHLRQTLEAKAHADKAAILPHGNAEPMAGRGHIVLALGDARAALEDFNEALRLKADVILFALGARAGLRTARAAVAGDCGL